MIGITWQNAWVGGVIYALGDSVATLLTHEFLCQRMLGMLLLGGTLLAWEIPNYFQFIERRFKQPSTKNALLRSFSAAIYFNPLWIARHLCFIKIFSGEWQAINSSILGIATFSFIYGFPISLLANYIIQNKVVLKSRFAASSIFSAFMAIYFAFSEMIFATPYL